MCGGSLNATRSSAIAETACVGRMTKITAPSLRRSDHSRSPISVSTRTDRPKPSFLFLQFYLLFPNRPKRVKVNKFLRQLLCYSLWWLYFHLCAFFLFSHRRIRGGGTMPSGGPAMLFSVRRISREAISPYVLVKGFE